MPITHFPYSDDEKAINPGIIYNFCFGGDWIACQALISMFKDGWEFVSSSNDSGFTFFKLRKYIK